jgi:2-dehydropantoate 2-reductase
VLVSFQNGIRNVGALRDLLPRVTVLAGMVPFNVLARGEGRFHQGSGGALAVEDHPALDRLAPAFAAAGLPLARHADMRAVQWGKLLLNLNNAINALSGQPLAQELSDRTYRRCLAAAMHEALDLLARAKQPVVKLTALPPRWMARLLPMPDAIFSRLARKVVAIDPHARSSMWDDLVAGRPTEIDHIQGEVVALAARLGTAAPINAAVVALVHAVERGAPRVWDGAALWRALRAEI